MEGPRQNSVSGRRSVARSDAASLQDHGDLDLLQFARNSSSSSRGSEVDSDECEGVRPPLLAHAHSQSSTSSGLSEATFVYYGASPVCKPALFSNDPGPGPDRDEEIPLSPPCVNDPDPAYAAVPQHANARAFERPRWGYLAVFAALCTVAYPFLRFVASLASKKSIFWTRAIVGIGTGVLGFWLAYITVELAKRFLEASTWATVIQASRPDDDGARDPGIPLRDLDTYTQDPTSEWNALRILMNRLRDRNTARAVRGSYDRRPWSLFILFFLFLMFLASSLSFILGRIVSIKTTSVVQYDEFNEVYVWGDLSDADLAGADNLFNVFEEFAETWTLAPFASLTDFPSFVSFDFENDTTVYFADSYASQLRTDGVGFGTFDLGTETTNVKNMTAVNDTSTDDQWVGFVQFPKWGIRISCETLPQPETYLTPVSQDGFTYIFVPDFFLKELFANLSLPYPDLPAINLTSVLSTNDSVPTGVDESSIAVIGKFYNNGVAHSFKSSPVEMGTSGNGWIEIEVLSVRLNSTYTPNGTFPVRGEPIADASGVETYIGYDAAVCVEAYEAWIVETYNATDVPPASTRIVGKNASTPDVDMTDSGAKRKQKLSEEADAKGVNVQRTLNSTGKAHAFAVAHDNSINQMVKDNGRDVWYVPSPLIVSFTNGYGPTGYTALSATHYARARAAADATNVLPFLAGSGALAARFYPVRVLAFAHVLVVPFLVATLALLAVGLVAGMCVPTLPRGVPRRGFDLLSWLAMLHGYDVIGQLPILPGGCAGNVENKDIEEIKKQLGDVRVSL